MATAVGILHVYTKALNTLCGNPGSFVSISQMQNKTGFLITLFNDIIKVIRLMKKGI